MGKSNRSWNDKGAEKWLSNVIPKEQGNFRDDKAFEIEFLFLLVSYGETVIFPSLKKWCHDKTFCLLKVHFVHHLVLFIQKGDCSSIKTTFPNPRNFWILLCMLFCRSIFIIMCLDNKMKDHQGCSLILLHFTSWLLLRAKYNLVAYSPNKNLLSKPFCWSVIIHVCLNTKMRD